MDKIDCEILEHEYLRLAHANARLDAQNKEIVTKAKELVACVKRREKRKNTMLAIAIANMLLGNILCVIGVLL